MDAACISQQIVSARENAAMVHPSTALVYYEAVLPQLQRYVFAGGHRAMDCHPLLSNPPTPADCVPA